MKVSEDFIETFHEDLLFGYVSRYNRNLTVDFIINEGYVMVVSRRGYSALTE